ncbi:hypothetical protein [Stakelama saccharophila]|uniref:Uncharacterized protein n=1 Tax=Stakelama saccharophila TaxID=3075605 RepID=A0ABZ0B8W9_9SPHN|nr:hypothetical protein [Stakelama sp. W311]WNO53730.1 hypothetical protein RPR59_00215 [Stakelama sp. W311]
MSAIGWKLDAGERTELLDRFPPVWPDVVADHVTLKADASADEPLPTRKTAEIVGSIDDGEGLQAFVVSIGGTTDRPDGSTYHITWSLDRRRGRTAAQSNEVIAALGWKQLPTPVPIHIEPARFG